MGERHCRAMSRPWEEDGILQREGLVVFRAQTHKSFGKSHFISFKDYGMTHINTDSREEPKIHTLWYIDAIEIHFNSVPY